MTRIRVGSCPGEPTGGVRETVARLRAGVRGRGAAVSAAAAAVGMHDSHRMSPCCQSRHVEESEIECWLDGLTDRIGRFRVWSRVYLGGRGHPRALSRASPRVSDDRRAPRRTPRRVRGPPRVGPPAAVTGREGWVGKPGRFTTPRPTVKQVAFGGQARVAGRGKGGAGRAGTAGRARVGARGAEWSFGCSFRRHEAVPAGAAQGGARCREGAGQGGSRGSRGSCRRSRTRT